MSNLRSGCHAIRILFLALFLPLLICANFSVAQQASTTSNTGSIRGTVVDSKSAQPLNGATVALRSLHGGGGEGNSAVTASDGAFSFAHVAPGRYRLVASHNGYVDSTGDRGASYGFRATGISLSVAAGQDIDSVVVRLTPTGVITGRVTNERDEPMPGVLVQVMKATFRSGHKEFSDARTGFTDDRGEYRVWGLAPGRYYLKATNPRVWERGASAAQVYVPTFYPGVLDASQTEPVELHPGDEVGGINFSLAAFRAVHVRGRVLASNGLPAKSADVTLSQLTGNGFTAEADTDPTGKFDLRGVPPGTYQLVAQSSDSSESAHLLMGRANVSVGETNLDAPDIVVFPGATVSGHVRVDGDKKLTLPHTFAALKPMSPSESAGVETASVQPDGSFTFHDVPEGEYGLTLSPLPDGYYVKSGGDTATPGLVVSHGHAPPADIRLNSGAGRVQGVVYKDKDNQEVAPSVTVALVPDATHRSNSEYYRVATTDRSGQFMLASIPPGDYSLLALEDIDRDAFMDPDFIQRYESVGRPVRIEDGSSLNLQVQVIVPSEDAPQ